MSKPTEYICCGGDAEPLVPEEEQEQSLRRMQSAEQEQEQSLRRLAQLMHWHQLFIERGLRVGTQVTNTRVSTSSFAYVLTADEVKSSSGTQSELANVLSILEKSYKVLEKSDAGNVEEAYRTVRQVWNHPWLNSDALDDLIFHLGSDALPFFYGMCLRLPGIVMAADTHVVKSEISEIASHKELSLDSYRSKFRSSCLPTGSRKDRYHAWRRTHERNEVYVTSHKFYDFVELSRENQDMLETALLFIFSSGSKTDADNLLLTPFGQSLVYKIWELSWPQFVWQNIMNLLFQFFLSFWMAPFVHKARTEPALPETWQVYILSAFSVRGVLSLLIELISIWMSKGNRLLLLRAYVNPFTVICLCVEGYTAYFGVRIVMDVHNMRGSDVDPEKAIQDTVIYKRPMTFAMVIFAKWMLAMLNTLNFEFLSNTALPAWFAIKSKESVTFLNYLGVLTIGCTLAYYSLPVPDIHTYDPNWGALSGVGGYLLALTRIFKLTLMGDFDMWGLEGVDDQLDMSHTAVKHAKVYAMEHAKPIETMHHALRIWILFLSLLFPVVLLNVYVGIVSNAYDDAKTKGIAISGEFRVTSCFRLLLHRRFWSKICCGCSSLDNCLTCFGRLCGQAVREVQPNDNSVTFVRIPKGRVRNAAEVIEATSEQ